MKFEINKRNEIRIWDTSNPNENQAPFLYQPTWPNGDRWSDRAEAEDWANVFIESLQNPESEYLPGMSPDEPKRLRPEPVEIDIETGLPIEPADTEA